jgi:hypothetical protein
MNSWNGGKPIRCSAHALGYRVKRGFTVEEVETAIRESTWEPSKRGRLECRKNFPYNSDWNSRFYATKQVCPIFVDEETEIVVITVYTYFF